MGEGSKEESEKTSNNRETSKKRSSGHDMGIEFDFREEKSGLFGAVKRPVAKVTLINKDNKIPQILYVDSGADITLVPRSVGEILDLDDPKPSEIIDIKGIGEKGVPIVLRSVTIQLVDININARIGWALIEDVPLLLGREDFFKYFDIIFSKNKKTIFRYEKQYKTPMYNLS